jgi:mannosyl-oligosaccharide glucosidase
MGRAASGHSLSPAQPLAQPLLEPAGPSPALPRCPCSPPPACRRNTEQDPPYWRGQIWVNINYLALRALHHYSQAPGPHAGAAAEAYSALRGGLVRTLVLQYRRTGYLWEQYEDDSGVGTSSHPFTGWTALLTLAVSEAYR